MDTLTALTTRVSAPRLEAPGPSDEQLDMLLRAAIRAPDHGLLRPWRFIVLQGRQRERLGDIMVAHLLEEQPDADNRARDIARSKALRAPTIIVAVAEVTEGHKIPVWEQVLAVGASVQNMMLAAYEQVLAPCGAPVPWPIPPWPRKSSASRPRIRSSPTCTWANPWAA